jgi:hypothetical protein
MEDTVSSDVINVVIVKNTPIIIATVVVFFVRAFLDTIH